MSKNTDIVFLELYGIDERRVRDLQIEAVQADDDIVSEICASALEGHRWAVIECARLILTSQRLHLAH